MAWRRVVFLLIAALYCILAILYAVLTPPWESPDEPAHYLYVQQLAERGRPPTDPGIRQTQRFYNDHPYLSSNYEWYQPALGYLPAAATYKLLDIVAPNSLPRTIPPFNPNRLSEASLFMHPAPHPLSIWNGEWGLLVIRIILSLAGLVVVYAAYRIGQQLDPEHQLLGLASAGWVAFLPQFTFINASVRSDMIANAVAALVIWLAVQIQGDALPSNKYAIGMGILLGVGLLTKHNFVYLVPVALIAIILPHPHSRRDWVRPLVHVLAPALLLCGTYYLAYPEARAALVHLAQSSAVSKHLSWEYLISIPQPLLLNMFYGLFGWPNVTTPAGWSRLAFAIWIVGACITMSQFPRQYKETAMHSLRSIAILGITFLCALAGVIYYNLSHYQPQGRLLFPALVAWVVFGFWGPSRILTARTQGLAGTAAVGFMFAFNLYALFFCLVPAYY